MGIAVGPSKRAILSTRPQQFIAKAVATEIIVYWCRLPIGPHQQLHVTSALISPLEQWLLHLSSPGLPLHPNSNRLPSVAPQRYTLPILSTNNPRGFLWKNIRLSYHPPCSQNKQLTDGYALMMVATESMIEEMGLAIGFFYFTIKSNLQQIKPDEIGFAGGKNITLQ